MPKPDRRVVRSNQPKTALYLYLARQANAYGLSGIALADRQGRLIAGSRGSKHVDLSSLAAAGRAQAKSPGGKRRSLTATQLKVRGEEYYLASLGTKTPKVAEIAQAIARIL